MKVEELNERKKNNVSVFGMIDGECGKNLTYTVFH